MAELLTKQVIFPGTDRILKHEVIGIVSDTLY